MDILSFVIIAIIVVQIIFFWRNLQRMREFKKIFSAPLSWGISKDPLSGFVSGIRGNGNKTFDAIRNSINKYLFSNKGSVIDFGLLKDAIDRHCDSIEDDINAQTPVPLYCGLAGTMFGVIFGLVPLISSGALIFLLNGQIVNGVTQEQMNNIAANGINDLLSGVAWAMSASICGIVLTTLNSILFKRFKLKEEEGKNSFLAWMQAVLLPELPTDTGDALKQLVKNLNKFNSTFANNAQQLDNTLARVNQVYHEQDEIIKAVHDMDVMKMAKANVRVLDELQSCTDLLQEFNTYLHSVKGYTEQIERFNQQFNEESERLHILEEIRDFFMRHKGELSKEIANSDNALKTALKKINETSSENIQELTKNLTEQTAHFKSITREQLEMFKDFSNEMHNTYSTQMNMLPELIKRMEKFSAIPASIEKMISEVKSSNSQMNQSVKQDVNHTLNVLNELGRKVGHSGSNSAFAGGFPGWMRWSILIAAVVIAIACTGNTAFNIWNGIYNSPKQPTEQAEQNDSITEIDSLEQKVMPLTMQPVSPNVGLSDKADTGKKPSTKKVPVKKSSED